MLNCHYVLRVIFMLSTVVTVTDCCSSRILLLRDHTLKYVEHHRLHSHEAAPHFAHSHSFEKIPQHIEFNENTMDFNKNYTSSESQEDEDSTESIFIVEEPKTKPPDRISNISNINLPLEDETQLDPLGILYDLTASTTLEPILKVPELKASTEEKLNITTLPKEHIIKFYYNNALSCNGEYLTEFCLNGGKCFRYVLGNHSIFSCECADGYVGERCESKSLNELYVPATGPPKILMARIVFSFPMLIAISTIYIIIGALVVFKCPHKNHQLRTEHNRAAGMLIG